MTETFKRAAEVTYSICCEWHDKTESTAGSCMLRDIWERFGDYNIVRRFRLLCRATAAEFRPFPVHNIGNRRIVGAYSVINNTRGRIIHYMKDGKIIVSSTPEPNGDCTFVGKSSCGLYYLYYNTTPEELAYLNGAIFPRDDTVYRRYTRIGSGTEFYPIDFGDALPPGITWCDFDDCSNPDNKYMMMFHNGYGVVAGTFTITDATQYRGWKITAYKNNPGLLG